MRPLLGMLACIITASTELRAQETVVRFFDPQKGIQERPEPWRLPIFLQFYGGYWHGIVYYDSAQTMKYFSVQYRDLAGTERHGPYVLYYLNGAKALAVNFKNNKFDGPKSAFDEHGRLRYTGYFRDGLQHGVTREFRSDSSVVNEEFWQNGRRDSSHSYHSNGRIAQRIIYGKRGGPQKSCFDENGTGRNCSLFDSHKSRVPPIVETVMARNVRQFAAAEALTDTALYCNIVITDDGRYRFSSLCRTPRSSDLIERLVDDVIGQVTQTITAPDLAAEAAVRQRFQTELDKLPAAVPAYEQSVPVPSLHTFPVKLMK